MTPTPRARSDSGFTLIEMMIAISILAVLSILTAQSIQSAIHNRSKIQKDIERESQVRDALRVIQRDIANAFHHHDLTYEMLKQIDADNAKAAQQPQQPQPSGPGPIPNPNPAPPPPQPAGAPTKERVPPKQLTKFIGTSDSLNFTTLSHVRTTRDAQESDQAEVGYFLKNCRSRGNSKHVSQCLWRRESPLIDDDVTEGGAEIVLLENIQEFRVRYFGPEREEWIEQWKSDESGDAISKGKFPYAVDVSITVLNKEDKTDKAVTMSTLTDIQFPNNTAEKKNENEQNPQGAGGTQ
jgi:prepilin-type N-terminal cleavage/methylation domain-containing protein